MNSDGIREGMHGMNRNMTIHTINNTLAGTLIMQYFFGLKKPKYVMRKSARVKMKLTAAITSHKGPDPTFS